MIIVLTIFMLVKIMVAGLFNYKNSYNQTQFFLIKLFKDLI